MKRALPFLLAVLVAAASALAADGKSVSYKRAATKPFKVFSPRHPAKVRSPHWW